jgi:predicted ATPase
MKQITLRLLGAFEVTIDGRPATAFEYAKVRALLAYLAAESHRPHTRAELAALLWPDQPERAARASLSQALATLRNALGDRAAAQPLLLADTRHIQLDPAAAIDVDAPRFLALLQEAEGHNHRSWRTCAACGQRLRQALDLYRGPFLADVSIADSEMFEEWASQQRENLLQRVLGALERLAERAEWVGAYPDALDYARRMAALDPLLEVHQRTTMRLLALNGETAAALAHGKQIETLLAHELGLEPEDETRALFDRIRRGDIAGLQLPAAPFVVPAPPAPLVSRAGELRTICAWLRDTQVRAVTITGTGGIGKTRLALEAAHTLRYDFEDGVYVVELAALRDARLVADAVAQTLGVKERPGRSSGAALREDLREKHLLLVLDNFEHVGAAAPFVAELLAACPALRVLATSRIALGIRAEQQIPLDPLRDGDAVELLLQRARAAGADLPTDAASMAIYAAVCRRLDRLPLAIELIAVRARALAPVELLRQLERPLHALASGPRDLPARHQGLRHAIRWSYDLLDAEERHVLTCLGVFAGGWTVEAAQAILGAPIAILPVLERLHQASLVQQQSFAGETRFALLETIREFALELVAAPDAPPAPWAAPADPAPCAGCADIRQRHAAFFLALIEQAAADMSGPQRARTVQRLNAELANLRAALQTLVEGGDAPGALRLVALLWHYMSDQAYLTEGRAWLDRALALAGGAGDIALSADYHEALLGAAFMAFVQDDYAGAGRRYEQLLALAQRSGRQIYGARALDGLGIVAQCHGHLGQARELLERSIAASRAAGDARGEHYTCFNLAFVRAQQGDYEAARALFEQAIAFNRGSDDTVRLGNVLAYYAYANALHGDASDARPLAEEALAIGIREDLPWMQQIALHSLGLLAFQQADDAAARQLFARALEQSRRLGDRLYTAAALSCLGLIDLREEAWGSAYDRLIEALELAREIDSPKAITLALEGLACLWGSWEEWERAAQLFGAIEMLYRRRGARAAPLSYGLHMPYVRAARARLGAQGFARSWARGQALSLDAACALASAPAALELPPWATRRLPAGSHAA